MLLIFLAFLMKLNYLSKMHSKRSINNYNNNSNNNNNNNNSLNNNNLITTKRWPYKLAMLRENTNNFTSNTSSTSSGCDSTGSSSTSSTKENQAQHHQHMPDEPHQHHSLTPQQLQKLRYYQQLQQQQLQLLQQQLIQRRRLQQQLMEQGVDIRKQRAARISAATTPSATLTCNQQYLKQLRIQQQQQQQQNQQPPSPQLDNFIFHHHNKNLNELFINNNNNNNGNSNTSHNNNNNNNSNLISGVGVYNNDNNATHIKGQKSCRGMTEFSTNNDINNKTHLSSQPLQNSPRHHFIPYPNNHNLTNPSTATNAQFNLIKQQLLINNKNNRQTLPSSTLSFSPNHQQTIPSSENSSLTHSPTHQPSATTYRKPFNSPNNSPFAYIQQNQLQQRRQNAKTTATLPLLTHTQYQQHLNDLLLQQQQLQRQQKQLLQNKDKGGGEGGRKGSSGGGVGTCDRRASITDEELSEESLKQNVAIVLNNLDRYNNALRSIILNEQVNTNSSLLLYDDSELSFFGDNNNLSFQEQQQLQQHQLNTMATAVTPESDYNSNATTPGSRTSNMLPPYETSGNNIMQLQQQQPLQHLVGFLNTNSTTNCLNGGGGGGGVSMVSNALNNMGGGGGGVPYMGNNLNCSLASSHDFTHDNSDYQWFLDYGYRDGCGGMQRSILSSLSASYNGLGDLIYEDLAKNLDANLAEVDMESFRAEDIHSLLSQLPSYCKTLGGNHQRLQQSLLMQQHCMLPANMHQQISAAHNMSQTSTSSTNDLIDNSFCKSELLFSPVKESHISVDSLDMDNYPEDGDIILTCKANKDNYTIAFEGSVLYSDESFYEPNEITMRNKQNFINLHSNLDDIVKRNKSLEVSMSRSDQPQQCCERSKLQKSHTTQLQRYPSGNNNNTTETITIIRPPMSLSSGCVRKSSSLPNLKDETQEFMIISHTTKPSNQQQNQEHQQQQQQQQHQHHHHQEHQQQPLNVSQAITTSNLIENLNCKSRNLLPMCQIPITNNSNTASIEDRLNIHSQQSHQPIQSHVHQKQHKHRCCCGNVINNGPAAGGGVGGSSSSVASNNAASGSATLTSHQSNKAHISGSASSGSSNPPAFNLVKLFIKQKSSNCSLEDQPSAHTCMDVSSGCWPSSDANNSSSTSSLEHRLRKKSMNDSGKGSALSKHDEEADTTSSTFYMDASASTPKKQQRPSSVFFEEDPSSSSTGSLTATNSPAHRKRCSMPLRNPTLQHLANHQQSSSNTSLLSSDNTSEQLTQLHLMSGNDSSSSAKAERNKQRRSKDASRPISTTTSSEMITRSMQTSCGSLSTRSSLSDRFRCVPPSFLEKLNNLGEERQAPIYVIYPSYALPDLGFVKTSATPDVIFSPFNYKTCIGGAATSSTTSSCTSLRKRFSLMMGSDEDEILKTMDYKHVLDWQSLATLLPSDYRRRLKHIPEVNGLLSHLESELSQKPLFCLTPPVRRNRPHICDCNQYFQREQQTENAGGSSSSGSSQQPSSGYRGSSTLLTDSEFEHANTNLHSASKDNLQQMFVYQYEQQKMDSEMSPKVQSTPTPMPRGILRKTTTTKTKRNSMIEQDSKMTKLEKRRSLQEPPYHYQVGSAEELQEVYEEECGETDLYATPKPRSERLSRKDLDARARAENFLSSLPRNELKYYAEIASILESSGEQVQYDAAALKKEVSRALSQQKKVSFNDDDQDETLQPQPLLTQPGSRQKFSTPPNSPNISMATAAAKNSAGSAGGRQNVAARRCSQRDEQEKRKLESNRFKRLQIQWELMSKDSSMLKELASSDQTKSGGSTPTSAAAAAQAAAATKSRIPRPVSYPAGKRTDDIKCKSNKNSNCKIPASPMRMTDSPTKVYTKLNPKSNPTSCSSATPKHAAALSPQITRISNLMDPTKTTRSPSRIQPPKRYSITSPATVGAGLTSPSTTPTTPGSASSRARTPNGRVAVTAPNTPKKRVQSPRTIPRVR